MKALEMKAAPTGDILLSYVHPTFELPPHPDEWCRHTQGLTHLLQIRVKETKSLDYFPGIGTFVHGTPEHVANQECFLLLVYNEGDNQSVSDRGAPLIMQCAQDRN